MKANNYKYRGYYYINSNTRNIDPLLSNNKKKLCSDLYQICKGYNAANFHWYIVDNEGNNISWDNVFEDLPIMTQENAGIAKAGTGLSMNGSTVNVAINQENVNDIISDEIISKSKLDPTLQNKIENITIDRMDTNLLGVGVGAEDSPEDNAILTDTEKAKCGIWIQY